MVMVRSGMPGVRNADDLEKLERTASQSSGMATKCQRSLWENLLGLWFSGGAVHQEAEKPPIMAGVCGSNLFTWGSV